MNLAKAFLNSVDKWLGICAFGYLLNNDMGYIIIYRMVTRGASGTDI